MSLNDQSDKKELSGTSGSNSSSVLKVFEPLELFKKDRNFTFAHQKIEKLVAALYVLTNFFPADEPLKWSLRRLGSDLLHTNIGLKGNLNSGVQKSENDINNSILEITSLLDIASFAGLVSNMNLSVLKNEFSALITHIQKNLIKEDGKSSVKIDQSFFANKDMTEVDGLSDIEHGNVQSAESSFGNLVKDKTNVLYSNARVTNGSNSEKIHSLRDFSTVAVKKNRRQSVIIALLKKKKEIMIRDVSLVIRDCSEKTIQRELLSLVEQGVLKKEGERRWTKYTLA